jgi:uncharacterized membrane protein
MGGLFISIPGGVFMGILIMVLRVIHIFSGVFWVGFAFFNIGFLQPTVTATGTEGQKTMQYLTQKTRLLSTVYATATLTMLSGLIMYWILLGFRLTAFLSGYGVVLTIGSIAGVIAWIFVVVVIRGIFGQMQTIGQEIQAQGSPPTPDQATQMQALVARLGSIGQVALVFLVIALLGMSIAQYAPF